jgi:basic membrane protein A and related proteins
MARSSWVFGVFATAFVVASSACSVGTSHSITGAGVGAVCKQDSECHAGICQDGLCTAACHNDAECPSPSACFAERCNVPLDVETLWLGGVSEGEGYNRTHHEGMKYAASKVPYLRWKYKENMFATPGPLKETIDEVAKADKSKVIIVNSFEQQADTLVKAQEYPDSKFLMLSGSISNNRNAGAYFAHMEQAVYIAGKVAGTKAKKRIGVMGALVTPQQVREMVAFALGAKSVNPNVIIEVSWIGFWLDYLDAPTFEYKGEKLFREEVLTARMVESGCEVIYHASDNQRSVRYIDKLVQAGKAKDVFSIATNNRDGYRKVAHDGTVGEPYSSSLGAAYYNWGPLYVRLFDRLHRGTWSPSYLVEPMVADEEQSPVGFELNRTVGIDDTIVRRFWIDVANKGPEKVFAGPYETTGQRDIDNDGKPDAVQTVGVGEQLAPNEFDTMCWFVKGMVEKQDPLDPHSPDVEAHVPNGAYAPPADILGPPGADPGAHVRCSENL